MIQLKDVYEDYGLSCVVLFELLRHRLPNESISHREMPSWEMHCSFVARRPYEAWYLIEDDGLAVGAVYLSKQREIGISILPARRGRGFGEAAVRMLMELHPGRFLANINPANERSIALFRKLGFSGPIQITLEKLE